jgi:glutamate synthase domain-containing protein 3
MDLFPLKRQVALMQNRVRYLISLHVEYLKKADAIKYSQWTKSNQRFTENKPLDVTHNTATFYLEICFIMCSDIRMSVQHRGFM